MKAGLGTAKNVPDRGDAHSPKQILGFAPDRNFLNG